MGKGSTNTTTATTTPNASAANAYNNVVGKAQSVAATPYQPYSGELVAGLNSGQQNAIGQLQSSYGLANPFVNTGSGYLNNASSGLGQVQNYLQAGSQAGQAGQGYQQMAAGLANPNAVQQYMNPYQQDVVNATMRQAYQNDAVQQQGLASQAIGQGAYGGDRAGIASATLSGQQALANSQTVAGLNAQNYAQAQAARQADAGIYGNLANSANQTAGLYGTLGGLQGQTAAQYGTLSGLAGNLGSLAQNNAIQGASAALQGSTLQQQNQQQQDTALYGQFQQGQSYPFTTTGWLSNIVQGIGSNSGSSTATESPAPSTLSQLAGLGTSGLAILGGSGAFGAGGWLKSVFADGGRVSGYADGGLVGSNARGGFARGGLVPDTPIDVHQGADGVYRVRYADGGDVGYDATGAADVPIPTGGLNLSPASLTAGSSALVAGSPVLRSGAGLAPVRPIGVVSAAPAASMPTMSVPTNASGPAGLSGSANGTGDASGGLAGNKNMWMGVLAAGLGMMGGSSPNAAVNIGQGGLTGLQEYQGLQNADRQNAATQADIAYRQGTLGLDQRKEQFSEDQINRRIDLARQIAGGGGLAGGPTAAPAQGGGLAPMQIAPSVAPSGLAGGLAAVPPSSGGGLASTPATVAPGASAGNTWAGVPDALNPTALSQRAARYQAMGDSFYGAGDPDQAKVLYEQADSARALADKITTQGTTIANGAVTALPGANETSAARKFSDTSAEKAAASQFAFREVQPVPGGPTMLVRESELAGIHANNPDATTIGVGAGSAPGSAYAVAAAANPMVAKQPAFIEAQQAEIAKGDAEMTEQFKTRQLSLQRLQALNEIQQRFQTGTWASDKANLVGMARAAGFSVGDTDTADPAAFQEFVKNATANIFNDAKAAGGRLLVTELEGLKQANANPDLQPEANKAIIGQGIGVINYEDAHFREYMAWRDKNPYATATQIANQFEVPWQKANPVKSFVEAAGKDVTAKGIPVPPPDKLSDGQVYVTPKGGTMRWNASLNAFVPVGAK